MCSIGKGNNNIDKELHKVGSFYYFIFKCLYNEMMKRYKRGDKNE